MQQKESTYKRTNTIYGNCLVQSPTGENMFRCKAKKAKWYLTRDLAKIITADPFVIRLTFEPNGSGHINDEYYLSKKQNRCVVCGTEKLSELTKHHIVPYEYRKHFPKDVKDHSSHDVVSICKTCHIEYETQFAVKLKRSYEAIYNAPVNVTKFEKKFLNVYSFASALNKHGHNMSESKRNEMIAYIQLFQFDTVDDKMITKLANTDVKSIFNLGKRHGKIVYNNVKTELQEFVENWRSDFIKSMEPEFMPIGWSINRKI